MQYDYNNFPVMSENDIDSLTGDHFLPVAIGNLIRGSFLNKFYYRNVAINSMTERQMLNEALMPWETYEELSLHPHKSILFMKENPDFVSLWKFCIQNLIENIVVNKIDAHDMIVHIIEKIPQRCSKLLHNFKEQEKWRIKDEKRREELKKQEIEIQNQENEQTSKLMWICPYCNNDKVNEINSFEFLDVDFGSYHSYDDCMNDIYRSFKIQSCKNCNFVWMIDKDLNDNSIRKSIPNKFRKPRCP